MQIGLVGFAGGGRSTLFLAFSGQGASATTGAILAHSSTAVVRVPDARLEWLRDLYKPRKYTPAAVEFVDYAGIPRAAEKGKSELFARIRDCDALLAVVSSFDDAGDAVEVPGSPADRTNALKEEFVFADLEIVERRIEKIEANLQRGASKTKDRDEREIDLMRRCQTRLEAGASLDGVAANRDEETWLTTYRFLQQKPLIAVVNAAEGQDRAALGRSVTEAVGVEAFAVFGQVEAEIAGMDEADRATFLAEYGLERPAVDEVIAAAFRATRSIQFFTVGEDEVRAWMIRDGDTALVAAGRIHSDIARGFIRGEVTPFEDFRKAGSEREAKAQNLMRLEGKEYVVKDGDIVHFRFSV